MILPRCFVIAAFCLMVSTGLTHAAEPGQTKPHKASDGVKDYSAELPRIPPKTPAQELKTMQVLPGFRVELVAAEPLIRSPVALEFDEDGRMFVVEYPEYNQYANKKFKGHGCVRMLEDTNGDGHFDKSTVYVDTLDSPTAVACYDGGIFVGVAPNILYCKDTKGTGKADRSGPVFTGFSRDAAGEAMLNSFRWGLDNRFHVSTNLSGGEVRRADRKGEKPISVRGQNFLFDPRTLAYEATSGGGQHGMSMDDWGRTFVCSNSEPSHVIMYDARYLARNPFMQAPAPAVNIAPGGKYTKLFRISTVDPWRVLRTRLRTQGIVPGSDEGGQPSGFFTSATGITIYRGDAWPDCYRGNLFVGEVAGNMMFRARLEPRGVGLVAQRADAGVEFLAARDNWFRPVQFAHGPDGALYVIDMYRELIEGAAFLPPQILKHVDVSAGVDKGRIYRIVPEGFKRRPTARLSRASTEELVSLLGHRNGWHRDTAARLLYQRQDRSAIKSLKKLIVESQFPQARLHGLYALDGLSALDGATILRGLEDADSRVREHAVRLAEHLGHAPEIRARLEKMVEDPDLRVRYQLAFSLGNVQGATLVQSLGRLATHDGKDEWMRLAILSSSNSCSGHLFQLLLANKDFRKVEHGGKILDDLAMQIGAANRRNDMAALLKGLENLPAEENELGRRIARSWLSKQPAAGKQFAGAARGKAGEILAGLMQSARKNALDKQQPEAERVAAIHTLGLGTFAEVVPLFRELLKLHQPQPIQAAALETLTQFGEPEVSTLLLDAWAGLSPKLRATAAETFFSRPVWIQAFLDAVERGKIGRGDIDPSRISLLQSNSDAKTRARAAKLFANSRLPRRQEVVAAYHKALQMKGDKGRGKEVFKKNCSVCHVLEGVGTAVGADLSAIRDQGTEAIMLNILDPNREVKPQFLTYVLVTDAGRLITGMITAETANSITVRRADGTSETVLRIHIEELRSTGISFMPEGLEKQVDVKSMADLLAYLNSIK